MLINLCDTNDKISLISGAAATLDVYASYVDYNTAAPPVVQSVGKQLTAITTATTTDVLSSPAASTIRTLKLLNVRNKHASQNCDVTVQFNDNGTLYELHKVTLNPGDVLEYIEGIGFFTIVATTRLDKKLYVPNDVINATTSFADVTGLTVELQSGKKYNFEAHIYHSTNATTTGAQFGFNIGAAPTAAIAAAIQQITSSVTAAAYGSSPAVTARDTAFVVETTGPGANNFLAICSGFIQPSADGTFAFRCVSEVAVAGGLVVRAGSWLRIWEADNG